MPVDPSTISRFPGGVSSASAKDHRPRFMVIYGIGKGYPNPVYAHCEIDRHDQWDVHHFEVGDNLRKVDPDANEFMELMAAFREKLKNEPGYILPFLKQSIAREAKAILARPWVYDGSVYRQMMRVYTAESAKLSTVHE